MEGHLRKYFPKNVTTQTEFESAIHGRSQGQVAIAQIKDGQFISRIHSRREVQQSMEKGIYLALRDFYISVNTFFGGIRDTTHLKRLCALFTDLDCEKLGYTPEQMLALLKQEVFDEVLPYPSIVLFSGRGLHLYWLLADEDRNSLPMWDIAQHDIYEKLKDYGADANAIDCARVLRLAGTINSANGKKTSVWEYRNVEFTLKEWLRERGIVQPVSTNKRRCFRSVTRRQLECVAKIARARGEEPPIFKTDAEANSYIKTCLNELNKGDKAQHFRATKTNSNSFSYILTRRLTDIEILASLRKREDCFRELILFLGTQWNYELYRDVEKTTNNVRRLNSLFGCPLSEKEVQKTIKGTIKKIDSNGIGYKYSDDKVMKVLHITVEEQKHLHYYTEMAMALRRHRRYMSKKEQDAHRYRMSREAQGKKSRIEKSEIQLANLSTYLNNGNMTVKEICQAMSISRATFYRLKKKLLNSAAVISEKDKTSTDSAMEVIPTIPKSKSITKKETVQQERSVLPCSQQGKWFIFVETMISFHLHKLAVYKSVSNFPHLFYLAPLWGAATKFNIFIYSLTTSSIAGRYTMPTIFFKAYDILTLCNANFCWDILSAGVTKRVKAIPRYTSKRGFRYSLVNYWNHGQGRDPPLTLYQALKAFFGVTWYLEITGNFVLLELFLSVRVWAAFTRTKLKNVFGEPEAR